MKKSKVSLNWLTVIFVLAIIFSTTIKLASVWGNNFAFTIDQGRDLIDVRHMVELKSPRLVGPTTSINGVLLGPFYYYFISIPYLLSGGSPAAVVYWQIFWYQLATLILWFVLRQKSLSLANIAGTITILAPVGFYTARYFWNANAMPIFSILFLASLLQSIWNSDKRWFIVLGLVVGASVQIEAAFGILFFPFALVFLWLQKKTWQQLLWVTLSFLATILPQLLFEIRHRFIMSQTLLSGLSGDSNILGGKLILTERFIQRKAVYLGSVRESSHIPYELLLVIITLGLLLYLFTWIKKRVQLVSLQIFFSTIGFLIFSFLFYLLLFSQNLKSWYTLGLPIFVTVLIAAIGYELWRVGTWGRFAVFVFLALTFYQVYLAHSQYLAQIYSMPSGDPSNLKNQLAAIDYVYQEAKEKSFKAYIYLPSVYDYTYQYLFWWYGIKKYGYMPTDLAYLPNQPEYIEDMRLFHISAKSRTDSDPIFLIIEKPQVEKYYQEWFGNFAKYCQKSETVIVEKLRILELYHCQKKTL